MSKESKDLLIQGPNSNALANVPSYARAGEDTPNLLGDMGGSAMNRLTFKGNRFRLHIGGEEEVLEDNALQVIILDAYPKVSRVFFKGTYTPGEGDRPDCASADGEVPLPGVPHPQSDKCATCPQNQKGSAITEHGQKRRACSYFKRIVVLLAEYDPEIGPVVADMKSMSLFGESYPDKGLYNLRHYAEKLAKHQTKPSAVVTEMRFDTEESVPKVLFRAVSYVDEETYFNTVQPLLDSGQVEELVDTSRMRFAESDAAPPEGSGGFRDKLMEAEAEAAEEADDAEEYEEEEEEAPPPPPKKKVVKKVAKKAAAKAEAADTTEAAPKKKVAKKAAKKAAAKPAPAEEEEETQTETGTEEAEGEGADWDDDLAEALAEFDSEAGL